MFERYIHTYNYLVQISITAGALYVSLWREQCVLISSCIVLAYGFAYNMNVTSNILAKMNEEHDDYMNNARYIH